MSDSDGRGVDGVRRCRAGRQRAESALDDSESALAAWCQAGPGGGAGAGGGGAGAGRAAPRAGREEGAGVKILMKI